MTYNQLISELQSLLESHAMIKTVKNVPPNEWIYEGGNDVVFPVCLFYCYNPVKFSKGRQVVYPFQFWFLDKSGKEREFERDVISDQVQIANDIFELLHGVKRDYFIDDEVDVNTISDGKMEDYLSGCETTFNITTQSDFDGCDVPTE